MSRLIDADALQEEVNGFTMTVTGLRAGKGVLLEYVKQYRDFINRIIDDAPTIDAVPVVHGRWETYTDFDEEWEEMDFSKCSICGNLHYDEYRYCPSCGAKMDLEVDGE